MRLKRLCDNHNAIIPRASEEVSNAFPITTGAHHGPHRSPCARSTEATDLREADTLSGTPRQPGRQRKATRIGASGAASASGCSRPPRRGESSGRPHSDMDAQNDGHACSRIPARDVSKATGRTEGRSQRRAEIVRDKIRAARRSERDKTPGRMPRALTQKRAPSATRPADCGRLQRRYEDASTNVVEGRQRAPRRGRIESDALHLRVAVRASRGHSEKCHLVWSVTNGVREAAQRALRQPWKIDISMVCM